MIFRAHARLPITPYWYDVGFRGTVRLEIKNDAFWIDMHHDVGAVTDREDPATLIVVSYMVSTPPPEVAEVITGPPPHQGRTSRETVGDGFDAFPKEYREFVQRTARRIKELATRALTVALWRTGARGGPAAIEISPLHLFWRHQPAPGEVLRDSEWRQIPSGVVMIGVPDVSFFDLDESIAPHISRLLDDATPQPLGHDLLREAWRIHESNPRAAVVVAVAAVETGVKEFLARRLPQTEWLLRKLPSPPLDKLLRDFLPTAPSKAVGHHTFPALDTSIVRAVKKAVELRNSIVHVGSVEIDQARLAILFSEIRCLLYRLDYHSGHEWALKAAENVQPWGRTWYEKRSDA